jgi:hypothetical protein
MEIVVQKLKDGELITKTFEDYFERLAPLIQGRYTTDHELLEGALKSLPGKLNQAQKEGQGLPKGPSGGFEKSSRAHFAAYSALREYFLAIDGVYQIFDQAYLGAESLDEADLSKTYRLETSDLLNNLRVVYGKYKKARDLDEAEVVRSLSAGVVSGVRLDHPGVWPDKPVASPGPAEHAERKTGVSGSATKSLEGTLDYIQGLFRQNKTTVRLYASIMQELVDQLHKARESSAVRHAVRLLDDDKTFFLQDVVANRLKGVGRRIQQENPPLKTFGMVPMTEPLPLKTLLAKLTSGVSVSAVGLPDFIKKQKACVVSLSRITYRPMEYSVSRLVNPNEAREFLQEPGQGVTAKTVQRFGVIQDPFKNKAPPKWKYTCKINGSYEKAEKYYVIETIDGTLWRALAQWFYGSNPAMTKERVAPLVAYLTEDNKPDRVSAWQKLNQDKALRHMFLRRNLSTDILEEYSAEIDTQSMRNLLFTKISQLFADIIKAEFKQGASLKSNTDVNDIIHDERVAEAFDEVVLGLYKTGTASTNASEFTAGKFPFSELIGSYLSALRYINRRFMKELHDGYNRNLPGPDTFAGSDTRRTQAVTGALSEVLHRTINVLNYKYLILNFH